MVSMFDRLNKIENTDKMKHTLQSVGLDDEKMDTILGAINELQDNLTEQFNKKLERYSHVETCNK